MFGNIFGPKVSELDPQIVKLLETMEQNEPNTEEYKSAANALERLINLRDNNKTQKINANTAMIVGGNLLGILIIVAYEQKHVLASKAMNFLIRPS